MNFEQRKPTRKFIDRVMHDEKLYKVYVDENGVFTWEEVKNKGEKKVKHLDS